MPAKNGFIKIIFTIAIVSFPVWTNASDYNVLDFGAKGDAQTDNTAAFQAAINEAGEKGGTVFVPAGQFRFNGVLTLAPGVTVKGIAEGPPAASLERGTMFLAFAGRDDEDSPPFIVMQNNSTLKGLSIYYPEQTITDVHPYPWTIQIRGNRCNLIDLTLVNSYHGIDCGSIYHGQDYLRNILMWALRTGIYIDRVVDIGRLENVQIHPSGWFELGANPDAIRDYAMNHLEGFIIGRCDWEYMVNCFVIWAKVGFRFIETKGDPVGNDPQANVLITQSGSDVGPLAVVVESTQSHAGIAFENCQFMDGILIEETNRGPVKLTNCGFWGWAESLGGTHIVNKGTGTVYLTACNFVAENWIECHWMEHIPYILMLNGTLHIMNCRFQDKGNTPDAHIFLGENVRSAAIVGNSVEGGGLKITNKSNGDVQILGNLTE
ncbi:hypothetical protein JW960_03480 [candidate division KSB1 bacterium]|nr:hypothetical protein [candidate division KSB1 bacterium]